MAFAPTFGNGFVVWDDDLNLTGNPHFRGLGWRQLRWMLTATLGGHYHPLTWFSFALDHALWGMNPAGYHFTSLALHAATAVCCYHLIGALTRAAGEPASRPAAIAGALIFALHPLRVESVAWASERRDVLSGFFFLLTVLAYLRARAAPTERAQRSAMLASAAFLVTSLLAKAWAMTIPAVFLLLDVYPLRRPARGERWSALLVEKTPYVVLALAAGVVSLLAQSEQPEMRGLAEHGLAARLAQAAYGLAFYVGKTLVPLALTPAYLLETPLDPLAPRFVASALVVVVISVAAFVARRTGPWALAAWVAYVVVVSPVLGLAQTGPQIAADRYTYLATIPFAVLAALAVDRASRRYGRASLVAASALILVLAALTFRQTLVWRDSTTLWTHTLKVDPTNHIAFTNRAWAKQLAGDLDPALADYDQAIATNPRYAVAYYDRGTAREEKGNLTGAAADYTSVLNLTPDDGRALNNRGWVRERLGDVAGAIDDYRRALAVTPPDWPHRGLVADNLARATRRSADQPRAGHPHATKP